MKATILMMTFLLFFTSCGGKNSRSKASFSVDMSALSIGNGAAGGALLVGHKYDDESQTFSFALFPDSPDPVFELDNGQWVFFVAAWNGGESGELLATNQNLCAFAGPIDLIGEATPIDMKLSEGACHDYLPIYDSERPSVNAAGTAGSLTFPVLKLQTFSDDTFSGAGATNSFRVILSSEQKGPLKFPNNRLVSKCFTGGGASQVGTGLAIPVGDPDADGSIFATRVRLFTSGNCSGTSVTYDLRGLHDIVSPTSTDYNFQYTEITGFSYLDLVHSATAAPTVTVSTPTPINIANASAYTVSGTCSEAGQVVALAVGGVTTNVNCSANAWTATIDVSAVTDGSSVSVTADHDDGAGNSATQASVFVLKDTVAPTLTYDTLASITSGNAASYTLSGSCSEENVIVNISLGDTPITTNATCVSNTWSATVDVSSEADSASFPISIDQTDSAGNLYQSPTTVDKTTI